MARACWAAVGLTRRFRVFFWRAGSVNSRSSSFAKLRELTLPAHLLVCFAKPPATLRIARQRFDTHHGVPVYAAVNVREEFATVAWLLTQRTRKLPWINVQQQQFRRGGIEAIGGTGHLLGERAVNK